MAKDGTFARHALHTVAGAFVAAWVFTAVALPRPAEGADFPDNTISLIVPAPEDGGMDLAARILLRYFKAHPAVLRADLLVINMPADDGVRGTRIVRNADPDGTLLGFWHEGLVTSAAMGIADFDHGDFEILGATGYSDLGIGVSVGSPYRNLDELLDTARAAPGDIRSAINRGLPVHFLPLMVGHAAGVQFGFVHVGGAGQRFASVFAMHTDFAVFDSHAFTGWASRFLRPVVMFSEKRLPQFPDVPTAMELGVGIVARSSNIWIAPRGIPVTFRENLTSALRTAMDDPDVRSQMRELGIVPEFVAPAPLRMSLDRWRKTVASLASKARGRQI